MKKNIAFILALTLISSCGTSLTQTGMFKMTGIEASASSVATYFTYSTANYKLYFTVSDAGANIIGFDKTNSASTVAVSIPKEVWINNNTYKYSVTAIGDYAFYNKSAINSVIIPDSVSSLGNYSFANCINLKSVTLSNKLETSKSGGYLFYNSPVTKITVNGDMKDYSFIDHFNYHTDATVEGINNNLKYSMPIKTKEVTITGYTGNGGEVSIPNDILGKKVTTIGEYAFINNKLITSFKFGDSVTSIQSYAFNNCTALKTITLGPNLSTELSGGYLFNGCNNLETINVPYEMKDKFFVSHFMYLKAYAQLIRTTTDSKVESVYNEIKTSNPSIEWNILSLSGSQREKAKYEVAKCIHSKLAGNDKYIKYETNPMEGNAYCVVVGKGTCAGISRAYLLLLLKAGFSSDEVQLIGAPEHQLAGIKLFNQWYFVECTNSDPTSFAMNYYNEWYTSDPSKNEFNGMKAFADLDLYCPTTDKFITKTGTSTVANPDTEAALAAKYGSANGGANSSVRAYSRADINMDNKINSFDVVLLKNYLTGNYTSNTNLVNCDINYDGKIDSSDVGYLTDIVLGRKSLTTIIKSNYPKMKEYLEKQGK